jgi:ABC-type dipeptide/oligopeptide/nickel transport system permease subunit
MADHDCTKGEEFKEVSRKLEDVVVGLSLVTANTHDLKDATKEMSLCIKALSESSIRMQSNQVTRETFFGKIDEIQAKNDLAIASLCKSCMEKHDSIERRADRVDQDLTAIGTVQKGHDKTFRWMWGILASIIVGVLLALFTLIIQRFAGV